MLPSEMTQVVRFKEVERAQDKTMSKVTFYLQRKGKGPSQDDVIQIFEDDEYLEMYRIVYKTPELRRQTVFYMTRPKTLTYVVELLKALTYDTDPFAYLQVTTRVHPSIQFQIPDLHDPPVRHLIEDMVDTALRNTHTERAQ